MKKKSRIMYIFTVMLKKQHDDKILYLRFYHHVVSI
jgi:hypothetical protein